MHYVPKGITHHDTAKATPGLTIFSNLFGHDTYIVNMAGEVVQQWTHKEKIAGLSYLLENGNLFVNLIGGETPPGLVPPGGIMRELDWDGNVVWEHRDKYQHHDMRRLPNGNTVYLGWELLTEERAQRVKGGQPGTEHPDGVWGDNVREVDAGGNVVWEWHAQDNLEVDDFPIPPVVGRSEWGHANTVFPVDENSVIVNFRDLNYFACIGKPGGDILWSLRDREWGLPHDVQILDNGNVLMFANRVGQRPMGSKVLELDPRSGETVWEYQGNPSISFFSAAISGAQRLASGNTLICEGLAGCIFEAAPDGEVVWEYLSPYSTKWEPPLPIQGDVNAAFRAYRYAEDSPEIGGRLGA